MKKLLTVAFCAIVALLLLCSCEKVPQTPPVVKISHEVTKDSTVIFVAKAETRPVIMFHWWIRCNGEIISRIPGKSLAVHGDGWDYFDRDEVSVKYKKHGEKYNATLEYYDEQYNNYLVSDEVTIE